MDIKPEVFELIWTNVMHKGIAQTIKVSIFDLLHPQVQSAKKIQLTSKSTKKPLQLYQWARNQLLIFIDQKCTVDLKEMVEFLWNKNKIQLKNQAIRNLPKDIDIT